ncbi:hypothetical protein WJX72_007503 [[Myrmecia] bisecta]|uniref:Thioredoxin-like fold domain-containing protein n=1 Tax=[Myrmecia] bisecta TaxID=41462 RepID=A0AAW1QR86_9CHLO
MPPLPNRPLGHTLGSRGASVNLAAYLDYVCPYSAKAYVTLRKVVVPHYADKGFSFTFYHQVQPWHPQSTLTHEAGLAVAKLGGNDAFWHFSDVLMDRQEEFFDVNIINKTRPQIAAELAALAQGAAGVPKQDVEHLLSLANIEGAKNPASNIADELKWEIKAARLLGIHVSPTTTLNGLLVETSSSWGLEQWRDLLDPLLTSK